MFQTLLIANRGEIAQRVQRTCREMGIRTIAVYSDADADTLVVREADLAVRLGPGPAAESYLDMEKLLAVAVSNHAQAIHPGYGFLSENPAFARACAERGVTFIGPPPEAVNSMGDKAQAKRLMQEAGVPVIPGYEGETQDDETLRARASEVGYPLLIKAVAGGGGRGIRLVEDPAGLDAALQSARREAAGGFGDDRLMLERFLTAPRHVEFQVLADSQGNTVHLFERECSVQRRHQKIIEETPSPVLTPELREAMGASAVRAAQSIGYLGAGTVEFLVDQGGEFYFLEMNTRLQVEHPITELTLGLDLVRLQIEIAAGAALPFGQADLTPHGHAIECRLNAEDPARGFLPGGGPLTVFSFPQGAGLRTDTGFQAGGEISNFYDAMLGKLIAWGETRAEAIARMEGMLGESMVAGIPTNLPFLQNVLGHTAFREGAYTTRLVEDNEQALLHPPLPDHLARETLLAGAAVEALEERERNRGRELDPASPWNRGHPWRAAANSHSVMRRMISHPALPGDALTETDIHLLPTPGAELPLRVRWGEDEQQVTLHPESSMPAGGADNPAGRGVLEIGGARLPIRWGRAGDTLWLVVRGRHQRLTIENPYHEPGHDESAEAGRHMLLAPLPGKVIKTTVKPGQSVQPGDLLMIVEAMKMEHQITAPYAGKVTAVHFEENDPVDKGDLLLDLEPVGE